MKKIKALVFLLTFTLIFASAVSAAENFSYNFNDAEADDDLSMTDMTDYFEVINGNDPSGLLVADDAENDGNKYFIVNNFTDVRTYEEIEGEYVFSVDFRYADGDTNYAGVFVRGAIPGTFTKENPAEGQNNNVMTFNYYEVDWYNEIMKEGSSTLAGSGIGIIPESGGISITVKRYCEEAMTLKGDTTVIAYPADVIPTQFFNIKVRDNGTDKVEILINNAPFATVELSGAGTTYESDETEDIEYFKTAVVKGADGTELMTVNDTRINSYASQIAVTARMRTINIDNVVLNMGTGVIDADKASTPEQPVVTEAPVVSAADTSADTAAAGETDAQTGASDGTSAADSAKTTDTSATANGGSGNTTLIIIIVVAIVVIAGVVIAIVMSKKKGK